MIEVVRKATTTDLFRHLFPFFLVILAFAGFTYYIVRSPKDKFRPGVRVSVVVVSVITMLGAVVVGVTSQPQYQVVKEDYYTTSTQDNGHLVMVARQNSNNGDLLIRVIDGSSQQVRKTVNLMDVDDETLLLTWNDAGPHSMSISPKMMHFIKPSEETQVKKALSNIMDAMTNEAYTLFPNSKTNHSDDEFVDDPTG